MKSEKGSVVGVAFILLLFVILGLGFYFLWLNLPGDPVNLIQIGNNNGNDNIDIVYETSKQFYENMRFPDKEITYKIESACDNEKSTDITEAFAILENKTVLDFSPAFDDPDIRIICGELAPDPENEGYFVAGEGGPSEVINTSLYSVILSGKASFFREEKCDTPNIALHEILHVLGFDHNNNPNSILYPTLNCDQTIDQAVINNINELYSIDGASDLKIEKVNANKAGKYLNFEIVIINQGLKDAEDVFLSVFHDGEVVKFEGNVDKLDLNDIKVGTKKILNVQNAKISRSSKKVLFIVDYENRVNEIFEDNNKIQLALIDS